MKKKSGYDLVYASTTKAKNLILRERHSKICCVQFLFKALH